MRSMLQINRTKKTAGFTLIEVLVIAPIVILVIGGFVALIMALVGDVLLTREQNVMAYETQDALDRIEQDTRIATQYLDTSRTLTAPQGSNDGTTAFSSSSALIIGALATDKNPTSPDRQLIYYADQPSSCASTERSQNRVFINKIIYYIKNGSLWRRVIVPPYNLNTSPSDVLSVCSEPWQQNSCSPGYTLSPPCQTNDSEIMKGIKTLDVKYYDSSSATTQLTGSDILNATTIDVTITGEKKSSGKVASSSGTVRASKLNTIDADVPPPTSPVVSHTTYDSPLPGVSYSWSSVPNATSYQISYQVDGGGWTNATVSAGTTSYNVAAFRNQSTAIRVASINAAGTSPNAEDSATVPPWTEVDTLNNWTDYAPSTFNTAAYTMTSSRVVILKGLVKDGTATSNTTLFVLPPGYRPANHLIFPVGSFGNPGSGNGRIDIMPTGEVYFVSGNNGWISLENIHFIPSAAPYTFTDLSFQNSWVNYNTGYSPLQVAKDNLGRAHINGLVRNGTSTSGTIIAAMPSGYTPLYHLLFPGMDTGTAMNAFGVYNTNNIVARGLYTSYIGIQGMFYPTSASTTWTALPLSNNWVQYGTPHAVPQYTKGSDGLVNVRGLVKNGTNTNGTVIGTLPTGFRPAKKLIFPALGAAAAGNGGQTRIDVAPTGAITIEGGVAASAYLSLDSLTFVAEP